MKTISVNADMFETLSMYAQAQPYLAFLFAMPLILAAYVMLAGSFK